MKCNFFTFSDTNWLQLAGTAMGTPVACSDATVSFGQYENTTILTQFRPNLLYYKRYIDDMIGIWLPQEINKSNTCNNFKNLLISRVCDRVCIVVPVRSSGPTASPPAFGGYVKWSTSYVLHTALQVVGCCLCNYYLHLRTTHLSLQPTA